MKMKELEEHSGFGREAIRFYIREGILPPPEKPKLNVAFYSDIHLKRLLGIRFMQQEREMSLARIKSLLADGEFDAIANPTSLRGLEQLLPALVDGEAPAEDQSVHEISIETGLSVAEIVEIADSGVIDIRDEDGERRIGFRDVIVLKNWGQARGAGFTEARGFGVDFLKTYQEFATRLAEYEINHVFGGFDDELASGETATAVAKGIEYANNMLRQLHTKALLSAVAQRLNPSDA